jgi:hypothetical protein
MPLLKQQVRRRAVGAGCACYLQLPTYLYLRAVGNGGALPAALPTLPAAAGVAEEEGRGVGGGGGLTLDLGAWGGAGQLLLDPKTVVPVGCFRNRCSGSQRNTTEQEHH